MSTPRNKITELITALKEANQRILTAERENREVGNKTKDLYRMLVQIRVELSRSTTSAESSELPMIRTEDLAEFRPTQLIHTAGDLIAAVVKNQLGLRADYRELAAGLEGADAALEEWQNIRIGGSGGEAAKAFRTGPVNQSETARPETPDPPLAPLASHSTPINTSNVPPSPPDSSKGGPKSPTKPTAPSESAKKTPARPAPVNQPPKSKK